MSSAPSFVKIRMREFRSVWLYPVAGMTINLAGSFSSTPTPLILKPPQVGEHSA